MTKYKLVWSDKDLNILQKIGSTICLFFKSIHDWIKYEQ